MRCAGLIGPEYMAGVGQQNELRSGNTTRENARVRGRDEPIGLAVDEQRWGGDFSQTAVSVPARNPLQLAHVSLRRGAPFLPDGHVFIDSFACRRSMVKIRNGGLVGLCRSQILA